MQDETIKTLISKIENGVAEVKVRSIATLYTKVTLSLLPEASLPLYVSLPGVLLQWINDNRQRSESVAKVLTILSHLARSEGGLALLKEYDALDFFQSYRAFLLDQHPRHDQYTSMLEALIKPLLSLSPPHQNSTPQQDQPAPPSPNQPPPKQKQQHKQQKVEKQREGVRMSWVVSPRPIPKKEEEELYSCLMEVRHSKRQLQLQSLTKMQAIIKYWGSHCFSLASELVGQLTHQFPTSNLQWLIISILQAIVRGIGQNARSLSTHQLHTFALNGTTKLLAAPPTEKVGVTLRGEVLRSIYSGQLVDELVKYEEVAKESELLVWLAQNTLPYSPKYFLLAVRTLTQAEPTPLNEQAITTNIQYYSSHFDHFPNQLSAIFQSAAPSWGLFVERYPVVKEELQRAGRRKSLEVMEKYKGGWELGSNLHRIGEVMVELQKGVGWMEGENGKEYIPAYLNALLTLGVAVERQDPLMTYYPTAKTLFSSLASNPPLKSALFQEMLSAVRSNQSVKYGGKSYASAELAVLIFSEESMFRQLFYESFADQNCLASWLQLSALLLQKGRDYCDLSAYAATLHCLTYHNSDHVRRGAKALLDALPTKAKQILRLCRVFSKSEQERKRVCLEVFGERAEAITQELGGEGWTKEKEREKVSRKLLKMSESSLESYMQIVFDCSIEEEIRLKAAKELLESLERLELTPALQNILDLLSENITRSLREGGSYSPNFTCVLIEINSVLNRTLPGKHYLKMDDALSLLRVPLPRKAMQVLLKHIYMSCFKSPFTPLLEAHFTVLLYPHLHYSQLKVGGQLSTLSSQPSPSSASAKSKVELPNYEETLQFGHLVEQMVWCLLNQQPFNLTHHFVQIVEAEIGSILHATKGYAQLHYLAYGFSLIGQHRLPLPDRILDFCSPLLSALLGRDQSALNCNPIATIIGVIGCRKSRQLSNLLGSNPPGCWKYAILSQMESIDPSLLEVLVKGILGISYGREAVEILRLVLLHAKTTAFTPITQTILLSTCLKFLRQDEDSLLRKTAICVLTELYGTDNLQCEGREELGSSVSSVMLEQGVSVGEANLLLNLLRTVLLGGREESRVLVGGREESSLVKLLVEKLVGVFPLPHLHPLTAGLVLSVLTLLSLAHRPLLQQCDLVDVGIGVMSAVVEKTSEMTEGEAKLLTSLFNYLYLECSWDQHLPKYLLTSTPFLKHLLIVCRGVLPTLLMQSIGRITLKLSQAEEDLFIYKLNQLLKAEQQSLMEVLCLNLEAGGVEYLKMVGWLLVIWLKGREQLPSHLAQRITHLILNTNPALARLILPFSLKAKEILLGSKYLQQLLKESNGVLDQRYVRECKEKEKKRKLKNFQLQPKQLTTLSQTMSLLSALFYWDQQGESEEEIGQSEGLKKVLILVEKCYSVGQWEESMGKGYLKLVSNMALSKPFARACSTRLIENAAMLDDIISAVLKSDNSEGIVKLSMRLMGLLVHFEAIRAMMLRARVVEQLSLRLIRADERGDLPLQYVLDIVDLFLSFSAYKDANVRLLSDKRVLEVLLRALRVGKLSLLEEKIVRLLSNLACFKANKAAFMSNREIHKTILGLLEDPSLTYRPALLALLYNILYKNSPALKLYRRKEVLQVIANASSDAQDAIYKALVEALTSEESI